MSELVPSEIIQRLEQRHEELICELDALNARLEQTLDSFARPSEPEEVVEAVEEKQRQGVSA